MPGASFAHDEIGFILHSYQIRMGKRNPFQFFLDHIVGFINQFFQSTTFR